MKRISIILFVCMGFEISLMGQPQKSWQWVKQLGGDSWDASAGIVCDSKNNLYTAGSFFNTLQCESKSITSDGNQDVFIAKFDQDGNLNNMWKAGGKGVDIATSISILPDDGLLICGSVSDSAKFGKFNVTGTGKKLFISKLDVQGSFQWLSQLSSTYDASLNLSGSDQKGNIIVAGVFSGSLVSGDKEISSKGRKDIFIARFSPTGSIEKLISVGSEEDETASAMIVDPSGKIVFAGSFGKNIESGDLKLKTGPTGTKNNMFLTVFDNEFNTLCLNTFYGDEYCEISSIKLNTTGEIFCSGSYSSRLTLQDTTLTSSGYSDIFAIKYKPDGTSIWKKTFGSDYYDYVRNLNIDNLGGVIISGLLGDTLAVDSLRIEPLNENNSAFLIQLSQSGKATWADNISGTGRNFCDGSVLDRSGNIYFTGSFRNDFHKGNDVMTSFGDQDLYVAKYFNCKETEAEIFGKNYFCPGSGTDLSVKRSFSKVVWNDTIFNRYNITASKPGIYKVSMLDKKGCLLTGKIDIKQAQQPYFSLGQDTSIFVTDSIILSAPQQYAVEKWQDYSLQREFLVKSEDGLTGEKSYWLTVKDSLECKYTDTISVNFIKNSGSLELNRIQIIAYPNPVRDLLKWSLQTEESGRITVDLTDDKGVKISHQLFNNYSTGEEKEIYVGNLSPGVYYLRVSDPSNPNHFKLSRVVKQ